MLYFTTIRSRAVPQQDMLVLHNNDDEMLKLHYNSLKLYWNISKLNFYFSEPQTEIADVNCGTFCLPNSSQANNYWKLKEQCCKREMKLERLHLCEQWKRGNEGEQDTHLGVVYWAGPQGALQINPFLTRGANHNFKASPCPISPWPWGQSLRQPLRKVSPLDSLEMDAVFLSDVLDVRVLISSAKGENLALGLHLDVQNSRWCLRTL